MVRAMQFEGYTCTLNRNEAKALVAFTRRKRGRPDPIDVFNRVMFDYGRGVAVATDGHKLLLLMGQRLLTGPHRLPTKRLVPAGTLALVASGHPVLTVSVHEEYTNTATIAADTVRKDGSRKADLFNVRYDYIESYPKYESVLAASLSDAPDTRRVSSLGLGASHLAEIMGALGPLCYSEKQQRGHVDGFEIRTGETRNDPIRIDGRTDEGTGVIALLSPWRGPMRRSTNDEDYTIRFGAPKPSARSAPNHGTSRFAHLDFDGNDGQASHDYDTPMPRMFGLDV